MLPWQPFLVFYIWGAHWRHLKNTTEPSMCGGDSALCQITLTTCFCCGEQSSHLRNCTMLSDVYIVSAIQARAPCLFNRLSMVLHVAQSSVNTLKATKVNEEKKKTKNLTT